MTKSIENSPPNPDPNESNLIRRLGRKLKASPKKVTIGLAGIAAFGSLGYWGKQVLIKKKPASFFRNPDW